MAIWKSSRDKRFNVQDVDELSKDLGLPEAIYWTASKWSAHPASVPASAEQDDGERRLLESARDAELSQAEIVGEQERERREQRADTELDEGFPSRLAAQAETDLMVCVTSYREEREQILAEVRDAEDEGRRTQVLYGLTRAPRYAKRRWLVYLMAAIILVVETLANGAVIADFGEGGLFAGWSLAFMISLGNIGIGGLAGWLCLRLWAVGHLRRWKRWIALLIGCLAILAIVWINLAIAYVRSQSGTTYSPSIQNILSDGFFPTTLEGLLIFALGLIIAFLSAVKFGLMCDPIRELEASDRMMKAAMVRLRLMDKTAPAALQKSADASMVELQLNLAEAEANYVEFTRSRIESDAAQSDYFVACERIAKAYEQVVKSRREHLMVASSVVPAYWATGTVAITPDPPKLFNLVEDQKFAAEITARFEGLKAKVEKAERDIEAAHRKARQQVVLMPNPVRESGGTATDNVVHLQFRDKAVGW
ncbi:hypothetical protein [uncultured Litoreibacter sp.]|uniref:hypothetical protein n=1 Tax=uncultured Litoreibacter sp. TaxID=1392394 RepID=UPI0026162DCA|nr:hypothetical protein [uncultured Litoreibacter sp.]